MQTPSTPPHTVDALLRVIEVREAEVALLKLTIDKLKLQLLRRVRAQFGASSERLDDLQIALIEGAPLYELPPAKPPAKADAANAPEVDRKLPAHLPREAKVYRPETSDDHHDAKGQTCGCTACGVPLRGAAWSSSKSRSSSTTSMKHSLRTRAASSPAMLAPMTTARPCAVDRLLVVFMGLPIRASCYRLGRCVVVLVTPFVAEWHLDSTELIYWGAVKKALN